MINYKKKNTIVTIRESIVCDMCGKVIKCVSSEMDEIIEAQETFHGLHQCGYGTIFQDEGVLEFDLCQHCLKKIIDENKINVRIE